MEPQGSFHDLLTEGTALNLFAGCDVRQCHGFTSCRIL